MTIIVKPSQLEESAKIGAELRHKIHQHPEIGLYLPKTQEEIVKALKSFGIEDVHTFVGGVVDGYKPPAGRRGELVGHTDTPLFGCNKSWFVTDVTKVACYRVFDV